MIDDIEVISGRREPLWVPGRRGTRPTSRSSAGPLISPLISREMLVEVPLTGLSFVSRSRSTWIVASYGGTKQAVPEQYRKRSAEFHVAALTMPDAITAGGKDATVPPQSVVRLATALQQRRRPVLLIFREAGGHATDEADTLAAFDFVVAKAP